MTLPQSLQESDPINILVVDDRAENRLALKAILSTPEYRILEASCEKEALRHLLHNECAVILLDVVMPGVDGFELAALIKEHERMASVPIIFLTAEAVNAGFVDRAYDVGAADYLIKPLMPKMVRAKVAVFAELYRQRGHIKRQAELLLTSERKQSEARYGELQAKSERRYRDLAESVPHIVWSAREDGRVDYFNRRWYEYTGSSPSESAGSWLSRVHPDDQLECQAKWERALAAGTPFEAVVRLRRPDGSYRWQLGRALPESGASGEPLAWRGTFTDVDEQKQLERTLANFKAMLDAVSNAVLIFDAHSGAVEYANLGATDLFGYTFEELERLSPAAVIPHLKEVGPPRDWLARQAGGQAVLDTRCRTKNGAEVPVDLFVQLIEGDQAQIIAIARDITSRKQGEALREKQYQQALDDVQARDEFLSIASHELRTPLTSLSLQVEIMERQLLGGTAAGNGLNAEFTDILRRQVRRLVRLIEELLDVSRVSGGQFRIDPQPLNLAATAREVIERYAQNAVEAGCAVRLTAPDAIQGCWDPTRMEQVFTNLLTNALKFGTGKPVDVALTVVDDNACFTVRDHGVGIPPEAQARVFERFGRAKEAASFAGLGLGLYITKQIVEAHGGTISVSSEAEQGAAFTVVLPRQVWPSPTPPAAEPRSAAQEQATGPMTPG
jgi:PAS domain S-box-containing protein